MSQIAVVVDVLEVAGGERAADHEGRRNVLDPRRQASRRRARCRRCAWSRGAPGAAGRNCGIVIGPRESVAPSTSAGWRVEPGHLERHPDLELRRGRRRRCWRPAADPPRARPDRRAPGSGSPAPADSAAPRRSRAVPRPEQTAYSRSKLPASDRACGVGGWKSSPVAGSRCMRSSCWRRAVPEELVVAVDAGPRPQLRGRVDGARPRRRRPAPVRPVPGLNFRIRKSTSPTCSPSVVV